MIVLVMTKTMFVQLSLNCPHLNCFQKWISIFILCIMFMYHVLIQNDAPEVDGKIVSGGLLVYLCVRCVMCACFLIRFGGCYSTVDDSMVIR